MRLVVVAGSVSAIALAVATLAIWGVEGRDAPANEDAHDDAKHTKAPFLQALKQVWAEPDARRFTLFVFVSMLAYSAQDLILEPFAGSIFAFTPGQSTKLSGAQHGGVFTGMLIVAIVTTLFKGTRVARLKGWVVGGCAASGVAMLGLVTAGVRGMPWPIQQNVFVLGVANGVFSIAAISAMMTLAGEGRKSREGVRMGLWGAAQANRIRRWRLRRNRHGRSREMDHRPERRCLCVRVRPRSHRFFRRVRFGAGDDIHQTC